MNFYNSNNNNNGGNPFLQFQQNPQNNMILHHGILVDPNWVAPELISLENPDAILRDSDLKTVYPSRVPSNGALRSVTSRILNKMDSDNKGQSYIRFQTNHQGFVWAIDFKLDHDDRTRTKRVYIERANTNLPNNFVISIDNLLSGAAISGNSNDWGICFSGIISETNLPSAQAAKCYTDCLYYSLLYLESVLMSGRYISNQNLTGRWAMSATLHDLLIDGSISVGGIIIRPIISLNQQFNNIELGFKLDFREDITVNFKGDREYLGNTVFTTIK